MKLSPYFDTTTQLIKMNPRTGEEPLILPPRRSPLTHLVIDDCHEVALHTGGHATLSEVDDSEGAHRQVSKVPTIKSHALFRSGRTTAKVPDQEGISVVYNRDRPPRLTLHPRWKQGLRPPLHLHVDSPHQPGSLQGPALGGDSPQDLELSESASTRTSTCADLV